MTTSIVEYSAPLSVAKIKNRELSEFFQYVINLILLEQIDYANQSLLEVKENKNLLSLILHRSDFFKDVHGDFLYKIYIVSFLYDDEEDFEIISKALISRLDPISNIDVVRCLILFSKSKMQMIEGIRNGKFLERMRKISAFVERDVDDFCHDYYRLSFPRYECSKKLKDKPVRILLTLGQLTTRKLSTHVHFIVKRLKALKMAGFELFLCFNGEHVVEGPYLGKSPYTKRYRKNHDRFWMEYVGIKPDYIIDRDAFGLTNTFLRYLIKVDPDVVLFLGDPSPRGSYMLQNIVYQSFPVGYMPCQIVWQPDKNFDGAISGIPKYHAIMNKKNHGFDISHHVDVPFYITGSDEDFDVGGIGLRKNDFLMVTPLSKNRLLTVFEGMSEYLISIFDEIFKENVSLVWLLVGVDEDCFKQLINLSPVLYKLACDGRIKAIDSTNKLRGLFRKSNVFFSPPGMKGGGGGAGIAVFEGLPVIAHDLSDSSPRAIKETTYCNDDEMRDCLNKVINDNVFRQEVLEKSREKLDSCTPDKFSEQMKEAIFSIHARGVRRLEAAG